MRVLLLLACLFAVCGVCSANNCQRNISALLACQQNLPNLPVCAQGVMPARDPTTCCLTCRIPPPAHICNDDDRDNCANHILPTLTVCAAGTTPTFNQSSCCYNCRPALPPSDDRPDGNGRCNETQFNACISSAPLCQPGERAVHVNGTCCPSCVPPADKCNEADTETCRQNQPTCQAGEQPVAVNGSCCSSCAVPRADCSALNGGTGCPNGTVCVRSYNASVDLINRAPVCRPAAAVSFWLAVRATATQAVRDAFAGFNCSQLVSVVQDIVDRFCQQAVNQQQCDEFAEVVSDFRSLRAVCQGSGLNITMTITAPAINGSATAPSSVASPLITLMSNRLMSSGVNTFVTTAVSDPVAGGDFTASASTVSTSPAASVVASLVTVFAVICTVMLVMF